MKHQFQIGDRVVMIRDPRTTYLKSGDTGTVCYVRDDSIGVESDYPSGGHDCNSHCRMGYGWFVFAGDMALIEEAVEDEPVNLDGIL